MKNASNVVTLNEFEAMALHKHYREMAKYWQEKGLLSIVDEYYLKADKWLDLAIEIANEAEAVKG